MNNKGFMIEIIAFVVIGIMSIVFFALFIYGFGLINTNLMSGKMDSGTKGQVGYVNVSEATSSTFSYVNSGMAGEGGLKLIAAIILFGYMIATFLFAWFSGRHPIWLFVYILLSLIVIIFSVYVSNAYEGLLTNSVIGTTITGFGIAGFIVLHLPYWTGLIALGGIVLSIVGVYIRRGNEE